MNLTEYLASLPTLRKLTKPQTNLIVKLDEMGLNIRPSDVLVTNPTNGYTASVDPLIACLINWVYETYRSYGSASGMKFCETKVSVQTFDRVRMLILNLDSKAFRDFID